MAKRIILGGILGGVVLFLWQSVSHLVLPLGEVGIKRIGNEDAVVAALRENIRQPGFYFFPAADTTPGMSKGEKQEAMRKAERSTARARTASSSSIRRAERRCRQDSCSPSLKWTLPRCWLGPFCLRM